MSVFRANEIIPGLWLGDKEDAKIVHHDKYGWTIINMHEELPNHTPFQHWFPLGKQGWDPDDMDAYGVDFKQLIDACTLIHDQLNNDRPVLVHCYSGVERSPLTVAYYLLLAGHTNSLHEAYLIIMEKRNIVQDRTSWLPREVLKELIGISGELEK